MPAPTPPTSSPASSWKYRPELDGLRSFAVVVIVFFHARVTGASSSFIVLDLFFVLSGFLVINVVLSEMDATGRLRLGRYYARRVRRLLPAAVVTILVTSAVFVLVASQPERLELVRQAQAALVYLANWQFIADGADYFAGDIRESPFMHFWSLSIEEQFYIAFPLLLIAWWKLAPGRGRVLLVMLGGVAALSVASQVVTAQVDPTRAYFATDARLFQLLAGAILAVALREYASPSRDGGIAWPRAGRALAVGAVVGYAVLGTELVDMSVSNRNLLATLVAGALVLGTYTAPGSLVARAFALPWMTYLGKISYGIYLWHWPVLLVLGRLFDVRPVVLAVMALALATAMASMSYQLLETPIRRGRFLDRFHWHSAAIGLGVSVLTALIVVGPILTSDRAPVVAGDDPASELVVAQDAPVVRQLGRTVPGDIDFGKVKRDRGPAATYCRPSSPEDCVAVEGGRPHVVVVGDSHARVFSDGMVKLAKEKGFTLSLSVLNGCPWPDGLYNTDTPSGGQERCLRARRDFYDRTLPRMKPDVVILANLPRSDEKIWQGKVVGYDGRAGGPLNEVQADAVKRTVQKVNAAGARAIMVKSLMGTEGWEMRGFDPLDCLARAKRQRDCAVSAPLDRPVADGIYESVAIGNSDAATVDLNPVFCPDAPTCRPIVDGVVVWGDESHLTGSIARRLRDRMWSRLSATGFLPE